MKRHKIIWVFVACALLCALCGCELAETPDNTQEENNASINESSSETTQNTPPETTVNTSATAPESTETDEPIAEQSVLNGRGKSDVGRSEPQYKNITGYVVCYKNEECSIEPNWQIPIYQKDKQFYEEIGKIAHKTQVLVLEQELEHSHHGYYKGYLLVKEIDTENTFYISVYNFINTPYWEYTDLLDAARVGEYIAEFKQKSDYYPVTKGGDKVELTDGIKVLVIGATGTMRDVDNDTHPIEALVYKEWKNGYGGVSVFFNAEDLSIIY